jgi:hypothetical protein
MIELIIEGVRYMKKKFIIVVIVVLVLALAYFGYKGFLLNDYKVNASETGNKLLEKLKNSGDTINVKTVDISDTEKTTEFENVIYPNILDNFILDETKSTNEGTQRYKTYNLNDDSGKLRAMFKVGSSDYDYYDILISNETSTFGVDLKNINRKNLVEKFNIKNNIDLIKYIINHYDNSVNIFSSKDEIKMNYLIKVFTNTALPISKINIIDGDINGIMFIIKDNAYYEIHLIHNKEKYFFTFANGTNDEYFTLADIKGFLSKIQFK